MRRLTFLAVALGLLAARPVNPQVGGRLENTPAPQRDVRNPRPQQRYAPHLKPVAETRLLMQGINWPNFKGIEAMLKQQPANLDAWTIIRGQALLIAENGNLLMLRPPRNAGEDSWMERATDLRTVATLLARSAADRNYQQSRTGLKDLAGTCNRCHQAFRVDIQIRAFADRRPGEGPTPPSVPSPPQVPQPQAPPPVPRVPQPRSNLPI
jgi:hypothetical protein